MIILIIVVVIIVIVIIIIVIIIVIVIVITSITMLHRSLLSHGGHGGCRVSRHPRRVESEAPRFVFSDSVAQTRVVNVPVDVR